MRRRPLLGGLLVGGAAYSMGKRGAQAKAQEQSQLRTQGMLTDKEFTAAKAKIIGI